MGGVVHEEHADTFNIDLLTLEEVLCRLVTTFTTSPSIFTNSPQDAS